MSSPDLGINENASDPIIDKSIAVLPFKNDSPDQENQYFCDGMMDEILNHLQKIEELGVKSRTAVEPYRNSAQSVASIARELNVTFILEGAVRKYGENFRVTTQLIDVASGNHLWSETYDGIFSDTIFVVQGTIAKKVASSLNVVITPDEERRIDKIPTTNIVAYDLYMKGWSEVVKYWRARDRIHLITAHHFLDSAIQLDPEYLQAIAMKGDAFATEQKFDSALIYAERTIALDPEFNRSYALKAQIYHFSGNIDMAIEYYLKAISLPPKDYLWKWYHVALGRVYLWRKNDFKKALPYFKLAIEFGEFRVSVYYALGYSFLSVGDYERADKYLSEILVEENCDIAKDYITSLFAQGKFREAFQFADSICQKIECKRICDFQLFQASLLLNEYERAEKYYYQFQKYELGHFLNHFMDVHMGYVLHKLGRTEEAEKIFSNEIIKLKSELEKNRQRRDNYALLSKIYAFRGDRNEALIYLTEYANLGFSKGYHDFILIDPFFESLRDDPEFKTIVKKAQEEKAAIRAQIREMEERGEIDL
jgi:TolB-like protein/tetratricopeptide (TPR) repeat protein